MNLEQLEFAITQFLDGTLPAGEIAALQKRLASDPEARALLEQHQKLLAALRGFRVPELQWNELARDFSAVVTGTVDEESKAQDRKLNAVLRSAMPPLPAIRWDELAGRISSAIDAEMESADEQDRKLDDILHADPIPAIDWEKLSGRITQAVAAEAEQAEEAQRRRMRIFSIGSVRRSAQVAVAAVLLLAAGVGIRMFLGTGPGAPVGPVDSTPTPTILVQGPAVERSKAPAIIEIQIGEPAGIARVDPMADESSFAMISTDQSYNSGPSVFE